MDRIAKKTTLRGWLAATAFGAIVLVASTLSVTGLHTRAAAVVDVTPRPPQPVQAAVLSVTDHYAIRESFVGEIEPARETLPAAERAGLIVEILVDDGDRIAAGQVLARLDARPLQIERTRLLAERASLDADIDLARRTSERQARLADKGFASRQNQDDARFSVASLTARRDAVTAAIAQVDLNLDKSVVRAPFDGEIAERMVDEGTVIAAGAALMRLQEATHPQARIGVPADRAMPLVPGGAVELEYRGRRMSGRIAAVTRDLQPDTRTVPVLIDLPPDARLVHGQVIRLNLERKIAATGAWVHLSALTEAERGLWSINTITGVPGGQVVQREAVQILHVDGERAFIRGTFVDGALVVPVGAHKLSNGQAVAAVRED